MGGDAEGMESSVSLSSTCCKGGVEGNGLEPSTPFRGVVDAHFRKIILGMLIFDSGAFDCVWPGNGGGLDMSLKFGVGACPPF